MISFCSKKESIFVKEEKEDGTHITIKEPEETFISKIIKRIGNWFNK